MFRRSKTSEDTTAGSASAGATAMPGAGKGRPTPTRREAEAAARARAKASLDAKGSGKQARTARATDARSVREAIKRGDERYLPARDKGPVRRFVRDYVDSRLCMAEFALPLMFTSLVLTYGGAPRIGNAVINATLIVVFIDSVLLRFRLRRELSKRFPGESLKGTSFYAFVRTLQLRFMRLPKPQVKLGQKLPERV